MKPGQVTVGLARDEDRETILALNKLEYGPTDILANEEDFAWRYQQNPAGQAVVSVIRDNLETIVGFIWAVPLNARIQGQNYRVATGANLVIHPQYRNALNFIKLIRKFEQTLTDNRYPLHFSFISERKYRQLRQQAPHTATTIPSLVKLLHPELLAQTYPAAAWQRYALSGAGRLLSPFFARRQAGVVNDPQIVIHSLDHFSQEFDPFWTRLVDKYPAMVVRDRAFLTWRFAHISERKYHILAAEVAGQMVGYAVLRCSTIRGVKTGLIMDLLVVKGVLGEIAGAYLLAEAETYFREQEMSLAVGLMTPLATEYRLLRRAGFIYLPRLLTPRPFHFAFFLHDHNGTDLLSLSVQDWFITLADYESF